MRNAYTILILLTLITEASIGQIVNIPDPNFKSILVNNAMINTNSDLEIQVAEAIAYSGHIECFNQSISNLSGIEAFVNLTSLHCAENSLTSLNVSMNTELTDLWCYSNQLTTIDVSNNPNLTLFSCFDNQLTSVDIFQNVYLENFDCSDNQLTAMDISQNLALSVLSCSNNNIAYLDASLNLALINLRCDTNNLIQMNIQNSNNLNFIFIKATGNPNLTCVQVDDATYSNANWNGLDFTFDAGVGFDENCPGVGLEEDNMCEFKSFPNPVKNELVVSIAQNAKFHLMTINGLELISGQFNSGVNSIKFNNYPQGIYIITIVPESGTPFKRRIIKN